MNYRLSNSANLLEGQPMFKLLARAQELERQGQNIIHFEIGDPDFDTPENIKQAAVKSILIGETHYTSSYGIHEMREAVQATTVKSRGFKPDLEQILVAPGANILIYYTVSCLVNPGDEVIVPDPGFPTYYSAIKFCGVTPVRVPLHEKNGFRMNPEDIRSYITPKTRMIIINSPQNPTGALMTEDEIVEMANIASEYDIYLYSDEIYVRMVFDKAIGFKSPAFLDHCRERTIVANGFSKAFAMTGWRLGVCIGPKDVIDKMALLLQTTSSCVSPFIQRAGIEAIMGDQAPASHMMKEYEKRSNLVVNGLNEIRGITCLQPGGTFYVFPNIKGTGLTSQEFADLMIEKARVALLPGTNFGRYGEGYVRLSCATSVDNINEGLRRIKKAIELI